MVFDVTIEGTKRRKCGNFGTIFSRFPHCLYFFSNFAAFFTLV